MDRECPDIGNSSDGVFALELDVEVRMPSVDLDGAGALAAETEAICPYAKMERDGNRWCARSERGKSRFRHRKYKKAG
ncbi:hypothetical protein KEC55_07660 [Burkholderia cepacia]|uniref:hypothetical protein n=1 Tax=Burkholderia cepacia TaxID=292 RepID=UPI00249E084D|nr:hypothetical protein [Burkholderia cepacia]WGY69837.1 hypothetical protein KEC55_07660 [Burkholderia cepacia]